MITILIVTLRVTISGKTDIWISIRLGVTSRNSAYTEVFPVLQHCSVSWAKWNLLPELFVPAELATARKGVSFQLGDPRVAEWQLWKRDSGEFDCLFCFVLFLFCNSFNSSNYCPSCGVKKRAGSKRESSSRVGVKKQSSKRKSSRKSAPKSKKKTSSSRQKRSNQKNSKGSRKKNKQKSIPRRRTGLRKNPKRKTNLDWSWKGKHNAESQ